MTILLPRVALVVLVGVTGSGKSTFARRHFRRTEILSSDFFRGLVADDESDQRATDDAFDALHYVCSKRLAAGRLTVVDATSVHPESRLELVALARRHRVPAVAIVLDVPPREAREQDAARPDRHVDERVLRGQRAALVRSLRTIAREGFSAVWILDGAEEVESATIERTADGGP